MNVAIDLVEKLVVNNTEYSDPPEIAEICNKYFNEIASSLDSLPVNQQNPLQ